jgi:hypothetical protein
MRPMVGRRPFLFLALASLLVAVVSGGCGNPIHPPDTCIPDPSISCMGAGTDGWSCGGRSRPDENTSLGGQIKSIVCAYTEVQANGRAAYCCTNYTTSCASDPSISCANGAGAGMLGIAVAGYSCIGTNRPDSFDTDLTCMQGISAYGHLVFCCNPIGGGVCARDTSVGCKKGTLGFACQFPGSIPGEADLGINQSRSGVPLVCTLAAQGAKKPDGGNVTDYCCYPPTAVPPGATCLQDQLEGQIQNVPGCQAGSFGFACTGTDTPDQDYLRMVCSHGGVRGTNAQGVPASLYCCEFTQ